jgi:hypothetical protein
LVHGAKVHTSGIKNCPTKIFIWHGWGDRSQLFHLKHKTTAVLIWITGNLVNWTSANQSSTTYIIIAVVKINTGRETTK